ncbi:MAG: 4Fe-4S binding protein [Clostridia bacterium]
MISGFRVLKEKKMIDKSKCISCGTCVSICPVEAISFDANGKAEINPKKCIKCGACEGACPTEAIQID